MLNYRRPPSGTTLARKTLKAVSWAQPVLYGGGALFAITDGLMKNDADSFLATALILITGAASQLFVRSRMILLPDRIFIINALFWHELPYRSIQRAEGGRGNGLSVLLKEASGGDSEVPVIAFAGSMMDHRWRTAEKAAKITNKAKKKAAGKFANDTVKRRGIIRDPIVEVFSILALTAAATSLFVSS
ncbi:hypothetical protein [Streptomyces sp. NPDC055058]